MWAWPTLRSHLVVSLSVPMVYVLGWIASPFTKLDTKQTIMAARLKLLFGPLQGSLYLLTRLVNQRLIFPAAKAGLNPFGGLDALNAPWAGVNGVARRQVRADEKIAERRRVESTAWILAHQSLMQKNDLDPLSLLAAEIEFARLKGEERPSFTNAEWAQLAAEFKDLAEEIEKNPEGISALDTETMREMTERAAALKASLAENPAVLTQAKRLTERLKGIWEHSVPRGFSSLGYDTYRQIMSAKPTDETARHSFRSFAVSYLFSIAFNAYIGARANVNKPENLIANPYGKTGKPIGMFQDSSNLLGINPSYMTETMNDFARWNTTRAAGIWLTNDRSGETAAAGSTREARRAGFFETAKGFMGAALNLRRFEPGTFLLRSFTTSLETAIAGTIIGVSLRLLLMGQPFSEALPAHLWTMAVGTWMASWFGSLINRAVILHDKTVTQRFAEIQDIERRLEQALERRDTRAAEESIDQLLEIRKKAGVGSEGYTGDLTEERARELLRESRENPPLPSKANEKFMTVATLVGAIAIAYMSQNFKVAAFSTTT
ncbi:MAG: hypothetical protein ABL958_21635, partial [Bdellovibrionia bacterium]